MVTAATDATIPAGAAEPVMARVSRTKLTEEIALPRAEIDCPTHRMTKSRYRESGRTEISRVGGVRSSSDGSTMSPDVGRRLDRIACVIRVTRPPKPSDVDLT